MTEEIDPLDRQIAQRIRRARATLARAIIEMSAVMRRVEKHSRRVSRLEGLLKVDATVRRDRARKAAAKARANRSAVPPHRRRAIRVGPDDGEGGG